MTVNAAVTLSGHAQGVLSLKQFGIVLAEDALECGGSALWHCVDGLNEAENVRGHNQKITQRFRTSIPIGVRGAPRDEHGTTRAGFDLDFAGLHAKRALEDIPSFIIVMMQMARRYRAWRTGGRACVLPLGDDERSACGAQEISGKRRRYGR